MSMTIWNDYLVSRAFVSMSVDNCWGAAELAEYRASDLSFMEYDFVEFH